MGGVKVSISLLFSISLLYVKDDMVGVVGGGEWEEGCRFCWRTVREGCLFYWKLKSIACDTRYFISCDGIGAFGVGGKLCYRWGCGSCQAF